MKILQVINNLGSGGAEKLIYDYVPKMKKMGYDVEILLLQKNGSIYLDDLINSGVKVKILTQNKSRSIFNFFRLRNYIIKNNYNIVHSHIFPAFYIVSLSTIFMNKIKLVHTEHNTNNRRRKYKVFKILEKIIYSRFDKIICISNKVEENLRVHIGDKTNRIVTINNGINLDVYKNAKKIRLSNIIESYEKNDKILVMIGRFNRQKDQITVIKALQHLPNNYKLLLIGEGNLKDKYVEEIKKLNLEKKVFLLGVRKDIGSILKSCDISILSSKWEGFGLVAVESMASGIQILGTNVDGLREVINDAERMFEVGNYKELAKLILISETLKKKYDIEKYDIDLMIKKYLNLYTELM